METRKVEERRYTVSVVEHVTALGGCPICMGQGRWW